MRLLVCLIAIIVLASCTANEPQKVDINDVPLAYQSKVNVPDLGLELALTNVADGRCPKGANCLVADHSEIAVLASKDGRNETVYLGLGGFRYDPKAKLFGKYGIEYLSMDPPIDDYHKITQYIAHVKLSTLSP